MKSTIATLAALVAVFALTGFLNHHDIEACVKAGNSRAQCNHLLNR